MDPRMREDDKNTEYYTLYMINITGSSRYKINKKSLRIFGDDLLVAKGISPESLLNIVFVGKRKMREIASTYKHEDVALPVLAFPYKEKTEDTENFLGEIIICYPQAVLLAAERNKKVQDMMQQLIDHALKNIINN